MASFDGLLMSRIALANIFFGFVVIVLSSLAGFFLATEAEQAFLTDKHLVMAWEYTLFKSAHGHCNLFGLLHIAMGLSMPYARLSSRWQLIESGGLFLGSFTMGCLMMVRSLRGIPTPGSDWLGICIGLLLSASLAALLIHSYGLAKKLLRG